jgi:hypothetical protein
VDCGTIRENWLSRYVLQVPDQGPVSAMTATQIVAATLRVDAVAAEVIRGFDVAGVESRLLKGAALARWLYTPADPRWYSDCDLLVRPSDVPTARTVLQRLGFVPEVDEARMPDWWREHAVAWLREEDAVVVDIHSTLPGIASEPERVWEVLAPDPEPVSVGGAQATTLPAAGRALHVALHAAQHGPDWGGAVAADLERAVQRADEDTWRAAAALASRLDATAAFATGLRLSPDGAALADRMGLPLEQPADVVLRVRGAPPVALGFEQLARAGGPAARAKLIARKVVPPATFMQHWYPEARDSRWRLALAYLWRPLWLLLHAPAGFRAWREARRK